MPEAVEGAGGGLVRAQVNHEPLLIGVGQLQGLERQPIPTAAAWIA